MTREEEKMWLAAKAAMLILAGITFIIAALVKLFCWLYGG
jgi:heme/copper-type cytochrome/quinol oxidase subunit 2